MVSTKKSKEEDKDKNNNNNKKEKKKSSSSSKETPIKKVPTKKTPTKPDQNNHEKKKKQKIPNGRITEAQVSVVPNSSCDSREVPEIETAQSPKISKLKESDGAKRKEKERDGDGEIGEDGTMCRFPMARIKRIMKSEEPNSQLGQDVVFLFNKVTEKFLDQFCKEAYESSVRDHKKSLGYKHLSSVVAKQRRYDFLSDFVPEKLKVEDALAHRKLTEKEQG